MNRVHTCLCQEPVHIDRLGLSESVDSEDRPCSHLPVPRTCTHRPAWSVRICRLKMDRVHIYLSQEPVHIDRLGLSKSVDSEDRPCPHLPEPRTCTHRPAWSVQICRLKMHRVHIYLSQEPVHIDRLGLSKSVHSEDRLHIMGGVPRSIENYDTVGCTQIDSETSGSRWDQEQTSSETINCINYQLLWHIHKLTSILKVLLKQYMSPTGPNKYLRGITPTKTDQLELVLFKVKISKDSIEKSVKLNFSKGQ